MWQHEAQTVAIIILFLFHQQRPVQRTTSQPHKCMHGDSTYFTKGTEQFWHYGTAKMGPKTKVKLCSNICYLGYPSCHDAYLPEIFSHRMISRAGSLNLNELSMDQPTETPAARRSAKSRPGRRGSSALSYRANSLI